MSFYDLIQNTVRDTLGPSLSAFRPELAICATIVVLLLVRMFDPGRRVNAFYVMVIGTLTAGLALYFTTKGGPNGFGPIFTGMLVFDPFSVYMRALLLVFALLFATFTQATGVPDRDDATEFYVLILGATLGMCLMVSANHMLVVFLGIEMASVPSYALAGLLKNRRRSTEAALKFAVYGAGTAGVMLYGISLLTGALGSAHLPTMAVRLAQVLQGGLGGTEVMVLVLGGLMMAVGLAFKVSAVPFHFWAPDVFEGATAEVAAFLSIASKAAALALLVRVTLGLGYVGPTTVTAAAEARAEVRPVAMVAAEADDSAEAAEFDQALPPSSGPFEVYDPFMDRSSMNDALAAARNYMVGLIALIAAVTCTFGNLAAYGQTNMKRLLAYSTIAHAGYMMMAVAAAVAMAGSNREGAQDAIAALAFYLGIYLFMNLGAFAAVAFLRNAIHSEEIDDYAGLVRRSPGLTVCVAVVLFSLVGLPPLAGFAAKFTIFAAVFDAGLLTLLVIGVLNTVLSLFYYLRVVKVMILQPEPEDRRAPAIGLGTVSGVYCLVLAVPLLYFGIQWNELFHFARVAAGMLLF